MAIVSCSECGKEISDKAAACPNCGAPTASEPAAPKNADPNTCAKCGTHYIAEKKLELFSVVSLLTIPMFLVGVSMFLFNWIGALIIIGIALMIDHFGRSKKTVLICPKCGYEPH